jgi:hypothetical protein
MGRKRRLWQIYFQCSNKQVLPDGIQFTNAYRDREYAQSNLDAKQLNNVGHYMWEDKDIPKPVYTVEGFYLVPEALYDEILKKHVEGDDTPPLK